MHVFEWECVAVKDTDFALNTAERYQVKSLWVVKHVDSYHAFLTGLLIKISGQGFRLPVKLFLQLCHFMRFRSKFTTFIRPKLFNTFFRFLKQISSLILETVHTIHPRSQVAHRSFRFVSARLIILFRVRVGALCFRCLRSIFQSVGLIVPLSLRLEIKAVKYLYVAKEACHY